MKKNYLYKLPFSKAKREYFDKNRTKIEQKINFIERIPYNLFRNDPTLEWIRTKYLEGIAVFLNTKLKITANIMSFIGLLFAVLALLFSSNLLLFSFFILLNLLSDGIDGVIARVSDSDNRKGEIIDVVCDTVASVFFVIAMVDQHYINELVAIVFISVSIPYTFLATKKSIKYINKAQSIGSRIAVGLGTILLTFSAALGLLSIEQYLNYTTVFFGIMSLFLSVALIQLYYKLIVNNNL